MTRHRENPPDLQETTRAQFLRVLGELFFLSCFCLADTYDERRSTITTSPPLSSKQKPELKRKRLAVDRKRGEGEREVVAKSKLSSFL
jgi:hypothetical protein